MKYFVTVMASTTLEVDTDVVASIDDMFAPGGSMEAKAKAELANRGLSITDIQEAD